MSPDDFERELRERMKARGRELDRTATPAPPLRTLLAVDRPARRSGGRTSLRLSLIAASVAVVALVAVTGSLLLQKRLESGPITSPAPSTATPTPPAPTPSSSLATASLPSPTPRPSFAAQPPSSTGVLSVLEPSWGLAQAALWAPDGEHFAVVDLTGESYAVYIYDKAGTWVGQAPGEEAAWVANDALMVLPLDSPIQNVFRTAFIAGIGYNDLSTMQAIPGLYEDLLGNGNGTVALNTDGGYVIWHDGALLPEVTNRDSPLSISRDGSLIAVNTSSPYALNVVRTDTGQIVRSWPDLPAGPHPGASFSPDGRHLWVNDFEYPQQSLVLLNVADGKKTTLLTATSVYGATWDGNARIFSGGDAGSWWLLSLDGGKTRMPDVPAGSVYASISSAGWIAAAGSDSTTLTIVRAAKPTTLTLPAPPFPLSWSPDGTELVVACDPQIQGQDQQVVLVRP